jgi:hypothetical protein
VYDNDVRVRKGGGGLCFLNEPLLPCRISEMFGRENFQGYETVQVPVASFVDDAHAALPERVNYFIVPEKSTDHRITS